MAGLFSEEVQLKKKKILADNKSNWKATWMEVKQESNNLLLTSPKIQCNDNGRSVPSSPASGIFKLALSVIGAPVDLAERKPFIQK